MKIFFSAGEPSGDVHGANLIRELKRREPAIECVGYGGPEMAAAGCQLHADLTALAVMWFLRVLLNIHKFLHLASRADRYFRHQQARRGGADRLPRLQLVDRPAGQGTRNSSVLLLPAANLGLGKLANQKNAPLRRPHSLCACRSRKPGFASRDAARRSSAIRFSMKFARIRSTKHLSIKCDIAPAG